MGEIRFLHIVLAILFALSAAPALLLLAANNDSDGRSNPPGGQGAGRDALTDYVSMLDELKQKPDFKLTPDQNTKIQAVRDEFKSKQEQWRSEHAEDLKKMQDLAAVLFDAKGAPQGATPAQWIRYGKLRDALQASAPSGEEAARQVAAVLSDDQRGHVDAWQMEHAPQRAFGPRPFKAPEILAVPADGAPRQPGFYTPRFRGQVQMPAGLKRVSIAYGLSLPQGYDKSKDKCPAIVFLHGAGEVGTDGSALFTQGPLFELQRQAGSDFAKKFPFIVVCPQCPPRGERWDQPMMLRTVLALLDELAGTIRLDTDRVYVTGLSMGGKGTWLLAMEAPARFAAIAPISASTLDLERAATLKAVGACWAIDGALDFDNGPEHNRKMVAAINAAGGDATVSIVPGAGHDVWPRFYSDPKFYEWFLTHKRRGAEPR